MKYLGNIEKRNQWQTPLAIFLMIVVTFATTSFKTFIFGAAVWQSSFLIVGVVSFFWLVYTLIKRPKAKQISDIIKELSSGN